MRLNSVFHESISEIMMKKQVLLTPWKIFQKSIRFSSRGSFSASFNDLFANNSESSEQSSENQDSSGVEAFVPFNDYIETRRQTAKKSVLVQVKSGL